MFNTSIEFFSANPGFFIFFIALIGLVIGSFLNVVIYRLPVMLYREWKDHAYRLLEQDVPSEIANQEKFNLLTPRSRCPKCHHEIAAWQNIPIISYLVLRGRCAHCKTKIALRYPFIEFTTALLSVIVAIYFGVTVQTFFALIFTWALIALTFIDIDEQLLPDNITMPLLWLGLIINMFGIFTYLSGALFGAILGYLILWFIANLFKLITKKEGMGHGDFKLMAVMGAWFGWQVIPFVIFASALAGAIFGLTFIALKLNKRTQPIPFGPYIAIAGWFAMFYGINTLWIYLNLFS